MCHALLFQGSQQKNLPTASRETNSDYGDTCLHAKRVSQQRNIIDSVCVIEGCSVCLSIERRENHRIATGNISPCYLRQERIHYKEGSDRWA